MKKQDKNSISVTFGLKIRELRKLRGLSQEAFAGISELDRSYIGGVERGDRNISLVNIQKIAEALDLEISELFKDIHE